MAVRKCGEYIKRNRRRYQMGKLLKTVLTIFIACALVSSPVMAETEQPGYTLDGVTVLSRHNIRSPL